MQALIVESPKDLDPSYVVGPTRFGRLFKRGRRWGYARLRDWWHEQQKGGPVRVFKKRSGAFYTTMGIVDFYMPRARRDEALERRLRHIESDLSAAFSRLAEIERRMGRRR